jgi:hypothetical protein
MSFRLVSTNLWIWPALFVFNAKTIAKGEDTQSDARRAYEESEGSLAVPYTSTIQPESGEYKALPSPPQTRFDTDLEKSDLSVKTESSQKKIVISQLSTKTK